MRRRVFIAGLGATAAWPLAARAQAKQYRIGFLSPTDFAPGSVPGRLADGVLAQLGASGYVLGTNLAVEKRGAETHLDRLPDLVQELVAAKISVIVAASYPAAAAAKQGAGSTPIVISGAGDPEKTGLVATLARPGGNLTGFSDVATELAPKRLGLLKEAVPGLRRVAMLWNANDPGMTTRYESTAAAAKVLGLAVQPLGVREPDDFGEAFAAMERDTPDGLFMVADVLTTLNRKRVYDFAAEHRIPAIYERDTFARDGGLMSYGPDPTETIERVAGLVDRILKGASPADLPVERPTRFRFVINLKTAKALGLTIPAGVLATADEVIE